MVLRTVVEKSSNISLKLSLFNSGCCENTLIKLASRFSQKESTRKEDLSHFFRFVGCCGRGLIIIQRTGKWSDVSASITAGFRSSSVLLVMM